MRAKTTQLEKTWEGKEKLQGLLQTGHNSVRRDSKKGDGRRQIQVLITALKTLITSSSLHMIPYPRPQFQLVKLLVKEDLKSQSPN
jgi:hypothetical protein